MTAPSFDGVALIFFRNSGGFSSAAARVQRRFRLIGCKMVDNMVSSSPCVATAWDVSNEEGDKLDPQMLETLKTLVGSEKNALPASVRGSFPDSIVAGPVVNAAMAKELGLVVTEEPLPLPPRSKASAATSGSPASSASDAPEAKPAAPRTLSLTISRQPGGGVKLGIERLQPRVSVSLAKPATPGGSWLSINTKAGEGAKGATPKGGAKGGGDSAPKAAEKKSADASRVPAAGSAPSAGATGGATGGASDAASKPPLAGMPKYRNTADNAAMYASLHHANLTTRADMRSIYHSGRPSWHEAAGVPMTSTARGSVPPAPTAPATPATPAAPPAKKAPSPPQRGESVLFDDSMGKAPPAATKAGAEKAGEGGWLGGVMKDAINFVEDVTGVDLDGDGTIGTKGKA